MAEETQLYKMNVRSPFYVVVDDEGKPDAIDDVDDTPDAPDAYVPPSDQTEIVRCGGTINIGTDVGTRFFRLDTEGVTGDFTIDYRVNVPVRITATSGSTTTQFNSNRFVGSRGTLNVFETYLLATGFTSSDMTLTDGEATGTFTFTKTDNGDNYIKYKVEAPMITDDYSLTFNCPTASIDATLTNPGDNRIVDTIFGIHTTKTGGGGNNFPTLLINDSVVISQMASDTTYMLDGNDLGQVTYPRGSSGSTQYIDREANFKLGVNKITMRFNRTYQGIMSVSRFGIFHDGSNFRHTYPGSELDYSGQHKSHPYNAGSHAFGQATVMNVDHLQHGQGYDIDYGEVVFFIYDDGSGNSYLTLPDGIVRPIGRATHFNQPYEFAQAFQYRRHARGSGSAAAIDVTSNFTYMPPRTRISSEQYNWYSTTD